MYLQNNFILDSDAYKMTHWKQAKKGLININSYGEHRIGAEFPRTLFFGPQMICMDHLVGPVIDKLKIEEGFDRCFAYFDTKEYFNIKMWDHILNKHGGHLPLRIKAVKEGTVVPINNILFNIEATDPLCVPLAQHSETLFMHHWYPCAVGTNMMYIKKDVLECLERSGTPENIEYMFIDFGYRATSCQQQAARGGAAFLINFRTSDTLVGDRAAQAYYGYKANSILKSVMASEHSVALQFGPGDGEYEYVHHMLDITPPDKICSIVIDTYDQDNFIDVVITRPDIKEKVLARKAKTAWRQDSGKPPAVTNRNLSSLANSYGHSYNAKGYVLLNDKIGLLQGDSIKRKTAKPLYESIMSNKWSADNLLLGSGSGSLVSDLERDTQRVSIKPSQNTFEGGIIQNVCKEVKSQPDKKSKAGLLKLHKTGDAFMTISSATETEAAFNSYIDSLEPIFENGQLIRKQNFDEVRDIAASYLSKI